MADGREALVEYGQGRGRRGWLVFLLGLPTLALALPLLAFLTPLGALYYGDAGTGARLAFVAVLAGVGLWAGMTLGTGVVVRRAGFERIRMFGTTRLPWSEVTRVLYSPSHEMIRVVDTAGNEYGLRGQPAGLWGTGNRMRSRRFGLEGFAEVVARQAGLEGADEVDTWRPLARAGMNPLVTRSARLAWLPGLLGAALLAAGPALVLL